MESIFRRFIEGFHSFKRIFGYIPRQLYPLRDAGNDRNANKTLQTGASCTGMGTSICNLIQLD